MPVLLVRPTDISILVLSLWLFYLVVRKVSIRSAATPLRGPPRPSFVWGLQRELIGKEMIAKQEEWLEEYGDVFSIPWSFGTNRIVLADPKALAHFYARETYTYIQNPIGKNATASIFGKGILWAEGDLHKRHRKAMTPAFSNASIRRLTSVFFDCSHKLKLVWDNMIDSESSDDGAIIEVQGWMNSLALDSVGIAGFSFDFGALDGKEALVAKAIDNFGKRTGNGFLVSPLMFLLAPVLPVLLKLPIGRMSIGRELKKELSAIGSDLLDKVRREKEMGASSSDNSIIGLLIKAEDEDAELHMSSEEIQAQNTLLLAGYVTTSISLTWALIELSRQQDKQEKLRMELSQFAAGDPTYEQLTTTLPYLDAVVHETLRLHPPVPQTSRECAETDVLPLSSPITTSTGQTVTSITIPKGAHVAIPIRLINTSKAFWGPTAAKFEPERWLSEDDSIKAKEIQGHRHLLTFVDGPRTCLGKNFAITEFKAALSVLIKSFTFELLDGPETPISSYRSILYRPKVEGQEGFGVPLRVRRVA